MQQQREAADKLEKRRTTCDWKITISTWPKEGQLQLENYNQYLANECRKKDTVTDRHWKPRQAFEKRLFELRSKFMNNWPATMFEILSGRVLRTEQIKKRFSKMSLLTHPDAGRDEEFLKTINRAYQIFWQRLSTRSVQYFWTERTRETWKVIKKLIWKELWLNLVMEYCWVVHSILTKRRAVWVERLKNKSSKNGFKVNYVVQMLFHYLIYGWHNNDRCRESEVDIW